MSKKTIKIIDWDFKIKEIYDWNDQIFLSYYPMHKKFFRMWFELQNPYTINNCIFNGVFYFDCYPTFNRNGVIIISYNSKIMSINTNIEHIFEKPYSIPFSTRFIELLSLI